MAALIEQVSCQALSISRYDLVGKGDKSRQVLIPAGIAGPLLASRGDAAPSAPVSSARHPVNERAVKYIVKEAAVRAAVSPAAPVHWLRHAHASHASTTGHPSRWCEPPLDTPIPLPQLSPRFRKT